jgi:hypothetical protein
MILFMLAVIGAFAVLAFLAGCGGPTTFARNGSQNPFEYDKYECQQQWEHSSDAIAFKQDMLGNAFYGFDSRRQIEECLVHKGWRRVE